MYNYASLGRSCGKLIAFTTPHWQIRMLSLESLAYDGAVGLDC